MAETLGVIGLGYVGLPLAVQAAERGYEVTGIDLDEGLVATVNARESPYINDERFDAALKNTGATALRATTQYDGLRDVENVVICVPTPTENNVPDISYVTRAASQVGDQLRAGHFVSLESTVNPGVTRDEVLPILEERSGLRVGRDFFLAHCPERIDPGNKQYYVGNLNRVVGGITPACTERAVDFYESVIDGEVTPLGSAEEAEFVKSWENSHRNVMIAMANSAAIICYAMGMDIDNVLRGLQSKVDQFGLQLAKPGIGPGGHCIPEDIHYVIRKARQNGIDTRFLDAAADLNDKMPRYAVAQLSEMMSRGGERIRDLGVSLMGLAYKPNIADMRRSPSVEVGYHLVRTAGSVGIHDPHVRANGDTIKGALVMPTVEEALEHADALFVGTAHDEYVRDLSPEMLVQFGIRYVLDGRNCLDRDGILANGIQYRGIGK
ncbi:MAG TPA: nucleotide sugar dehydrogenase [Candidatus Saccharimonadales bacterium]|nr:nucleotide sugar dehydrogenase [Candidatus Saccharimonadales bacterium]